MLPLFKAQGRTIGTEIADPCVLRLRFAAASPAENGERMPSSRAQGFKIP